MESLWKGASRMDAARGVKGQGRHLYAGPWSNDGAREPDEVGPDEGARPLGYFWGVCQK